MLCSYHLSFIEHKQKHKEIFGDDRYIYSSLIVVIVSWVYAYVQTHQNIYIKYVQQKYVNYTSVKPKKMLIIF